MAGKIYVVEDMAISRAALIDMLEDNNYEVVGSSARADKAWLEIKEMDVDMALLDINLVSEQDGIWLAKMIRKHKDMPIIFLTAYGDEKTLEQLKKLKPNGYLMKPYNVPTLITLLEIATQSFNNLRQNKINNENYNFNEAIYVRESGILHKLFTSEIEYITSDGNYIEIICTSKKHIIREKLVDLLGQLPSEKFIQTHRRFVVNKSKVTKVKVKELFIDEKAIPISKTFKKAVLQSFDV